MLPTSHDVLQAAADDAKQAYEENLNRKPSMRASRAGQPLLVLAMEDFIIPKLPNIENSKPVRLEKRVSQNISISMGYLFERALLKGMKEDPKFTDVEIITQQKFDYYGITGSADVIVRNEKKGTLEVLECKSLNVSKQEEAVDNKLSVDNWGYLTQLSLYHAAAQELWSDYKVKSNWKVYAKQSGYVFTVPLRFNKKIVEKALARANVYAAFRQAFEAKDQDQCLDILLDYYDPIPVKGFYYGRISPSCGFHFNPWSSAILDNDGILAEDIESRLNVLLEYAFGSDEDRSQSEQVPLKLLPTNSKY